MNNQFTPAQHSILAYAVNHTDGKIGWFPQNINGGARKKVLDSLFQRVPITTDGTDWFVAAEAQNRLAEIQQDDLDEVFSFHFSGKTRIIGIREMNVIKLLWWDPEHQVCPSVKKHT